MAIFYVKPGGTGTTGLDDANAWSFDVYNTNASAGAIHPGDTVRFKRGGVYYGYMSMVVGQTNNDGSFLEINYEAYGTGNNPLISGVAMLTGWTRLGTSAIYYASGIVLEDVPMLLIDGRQMAVGRYPAAGYLIYTATNYTSFDPGDSDAYTISGSDITALPYDFTGGQVVMRTYRWITDKNTILSVSGDTINYRQTRDEDNVYLTTPNNGFFIQNHVKTLVKFGDWCYNASEQRVYVHFGGGLPAAYEVKIPVQDANSYCGGGGHVNFTDFDFHGTRRGGILLYNSAHFKFINCNFTQHGRDAIYSTNTDDVQVIGGSIVDVYNCGFNGQYACTNHHFLGVKVDNIGMTEGMFRSGSLSGLGIMINGDGGLIRDCQVTNIGYIAVSNNGNNSLTEYNYINGYCLLKDDGGGIYSTGSYGTNVNKIIRRNVILNGLGRLDGAAGDVFSPYPKANGIYLDDNCSFTEVYENFVASVGWGGIFMHNSHDVHIYNNTFFNAGWGIMFYQDQPAGTMRGINWHDNQVIARTTSQKTLYMYTYYADDLTQFGTGNNNVYSRPVDESTHIEIINSFYNYYLFTLEGWRSFSSQDAATVGGSITVADPAELVYFVNHVRINRQIFLDGLYQDIGAVSHANFQTMPPFTGMVYKAGPSGSITKKAFSAGGQIVTTDDRTKLIFFNSHS